MLSPYVVLFVNALLRQARRSFRFIAAGQSGQSMVEYAILAAPFKNIYAEIGTTWASSVAPSYSFAKRRAARSRIAGSTTADASS